MWQFVFYVYIAFPGAIAVMDGHEVHLTTTEFRVYIEGFPSQADCLAYKFPTNLPQLNFVDALGVPYVLTINKTAPVTCIRQI